MGPDEEQLVARPRQSGWTLGMIVVAGAFVWSLALGPVVALMSGGQISIWDGWFALPAVASDPATMDAAIPGLVSMLGIGTAGLALAGLARLVREARSRRARGGASRLTPRDQAVRLAEGDRGGRARDGAAGPTDP